ncbi:hypothetical protein [Pontiella desulfatans]|uniref:hypothetical protein n=1 Tax=Pontiella desulfatans TaxID=2750659 RepID=UPI00109C7BA2|nr:hypothetical protein [Pontiella desulfatans]
MKKRLFSCPQKEVGIQGIEQGLATQQLDETPTKQVPFQDFNRPEKLQSDTPLIEIQSNTVFC